jgi:hypothetical protein
MSTNSAKSLSTPPVNANLSLRPGEIWELRRSVRSPIEFSSAEKQRLYSQAAQTFLDGKTPPRYVMIVNEAVNDRTTDARTNAASFPTEQEWQIVSVMVLSSETDFLSNVDLRIPATISGLGQDILAETWHVVWMLACNLLRPVGQRLPRDIYDRLLDIGDYYHGLINAPPTVLELQRLGLDSGAAEIGALTPNAHPSNLQEPNIHAFHDREKAWSDVLTVPIAAHHTYFKAIQTTHAILQAASELEQDLAEESQTNSMLAPLHKTRVLLGQWWQQLFETEWHPIADFWNSQPTWAVRGSHQGDTRSLNNSDSYLTNPEDITHLIEQLSTAQDEHHRRKLAKRLGTVAPGHANAVQALVNLLQTTQDDETLWAAIESLWQIDPGNPHAGIRRIKRLDFGMQVAGQAVALAVAIVHKANQQVGVLLQVYPTESDPYLPANLKLILLDDAGQRLREVTARQADIYIQLKFNAQPGEQFSVSIAIEDASITEDFAI